MEKITKVEWTDTAKTALRNVYNFPAVYSEQSAENIVNDIIDTADAITFAKQYQVDDINPIYRRIVVRNYKVLYKVHQKTVSIMNIVSTKDNPKKLEKL